MAGEPTVTIFFRSGKSATARYIDVVKLQPDRCAAIRSTDVDHALIRGLITAFPMFVAERIASSSCHANWPHTSDLHTAIGNIERQVGFALFDRSSYRLALTDKGAAFLSRARRVLLEINELYTYADQVVAGDEIELTIARLKPAS
jgi:hypothetical protein